jgi:hypothetical protein
MPHHAALHARALAAIPDTPVTVETRALALDPATYVHAIGAGWLLIAASGDLACVFGDADPVAVDTILDVAGFDGDLLLPAAVNDVAPTLSTNWLAERARIFTREVEAFELSSSATRTVGRITVRKLSARDVLSQLPSDLRREIDKARATRDVYAAWKDGLPASFAYVSHETERHGDLSIDTLEAFRRRGLAVAALRPVLADLRSRGKHPVWGAIESNTASLALARAIGLTEPAGTLWVATRAD